MSTFKLVTGSMFSGKTNVLVARYQECVDQGIRVIVTKPRLDTRYGATNEICSHDNGRAPAFLIDETNPWEIRELVNREGAAAVLIDEVQFLPGEATREVITEILGAGIDVTAAGLDYNFRREPFGATPFLESIPGDHQRLFARCAQSECPEPAIYTERLAIAGGKEVVVAGAELYLPKCAAHHKINVE
jgi:thymidine kinase